MAHSRNNGRAGRSRSGIRTSHRTGMVEIFTRPEQHWFWRILGLLVRFRAELTLTVITIVVFAHLRAFLTVEPPPDQGLGTAEVPEPFLGYDGAWSALLTMSTVVVVILAIPATRRYTLRRVWCVITRHRVRACLVKTRTMTHHGRTPYLVWARPSAVGERLRVWLPAGMSVKDLERVTDELATACWARETRIVPVRSQAALIIVDIVRRDPLSARTALTPTVLDDIDHGPNGLPVDDGIVVPLPARSTLTAPATPAPAPAATWREHKTRTAGKTSSTAASAAQNDPDPVTGYGGVDVSDYV